ncbi:hypothetical protein QR680_003197 [Steinernema hermaphroditum]|uniref:RRM domain-containing protein n=1 Tax=Steinernema hermaphroditum TaxID=289476 RepID=A0AA39H6P3_9BILA|nr:hypothetical protein QR680_003197 [Steinernema hermaphroditum]
MSRRAADYLDCKVYVGGLPPDATSQEIEDAFHRFGRIRKVWVARRPPGFAFVEFEDNRDAEDASCHMESAVTAVAAAVEEEEEEASEAAVVEVDATLEVLLGLDRLGRALVLRAVVLPAAALARRPSEDLPAMTSGSRLVAASADRRAVLALPLRASDLVAQKKLQTKLAYVLCEQHVLNYLCCVSSVLFVVQSSYPVELVRDWHVKHINEHVFGLTVVHLAQK